MAKLILMRHGQSVWNKRNRFTGWVDVPLSEAGVTEAIEGGKKIQDLPIDIIYTSTLIRAQMTAMLAMLHHHAGKVPVVLHPEDDKLAEWGKIHNDQAKEESIPVVCAWQLNERMYGDLQGLNKDDTRAQYGADQVQIWRRSYETPPPNGESLEMNAGRTIPYFQEIIQPHLDKGENVLVSAHGNSLRSIVMVLEGLSRDEVVHLEIPTGDPIVYGYEKGAFVKLTMEEALKQS